MRNVYSLCPVSEGLWCCHKQVQHIQYCVLCIGMCVCGGSYLTVFHSVCMHVCMWISIGGLSVYMYHLIKSRR